MLTNATFKGNAVPSNGVDRSRAMFKTDSGAYVGVDGAATQRSKGDRVKLSLSGRRVLAVSWVN